MINDPVCSLSLFSDSRYGLPLSSLYGGNGTSIASSVFIWASEVNFVLEAPEATKSGAVHYGMFPVATLLNGGTLSINQLRNATYKTSSLKEDTRFSL